MLCFVNAQFDLFIYFFRACDVINLLPESECDSYARLSPFTRHLFKIFSTLEPTKNRNEITVKCQNTHMLENFTRDKRKKKKASEMLQKGCAIFFFIEIFFSCFIYDLFINALGMFMDCFVSFS